MAAPVAAIGKPPAAAVKRQQRKSNGNLIDCLAQRKSARKEREKEEVQEFSFRSQVLYDQHLLINRSRRNLLEKNACFISFRIVDYSPAKLE